MNIFARLKAMNDGAIQDWLRKVGRENAATLGIALAGADDEVKKRVYRNMSSKAKAVLSVDVDKNEKLNLSESDIAKCAARLERLF